MISSDYVCQYTVYVYVFADYVVFSADCVKKEIIIVGNVILVKVDIFERIFNL